MEVEVRLVVVGYDARIHPNHKWWNITVVRKRKIEMRSSLVWSATESRFTDAGLLVLRVVAGGTLLLKHGLEKPENFSAMAQHFPNPLHIGSVPSLVFALIADFICSVLVILGLGVRWASAVVFINIFVAWAFVHRFQFFGKGADHGELIVLFLAAFGCLFFTGAGRYSVDALLLSPRTF